MGALSDFIDREFADIGREAENQKREAAIPAIPASRGRENSKNSGNSSVAGPKSEKSKPVAGPAPHRCDCGKIGVVGTGWFLRDLSRARWFCSGCAPTKGRA